jgi:mannosyl-3-phosphoglycerate phosphatase
MTTDRAMPETVIFTDLDETLLERQNYSFDPALPALKLIRERGIPLVAVSSKTASEIELYRKRLLNTHPFVSENGGGIFIPEGYFKKTLMGHNVTRLCGYDAIVMGTPYPKLRKALAALRREGFSDIRGFGDMSTREIELLTGLTPEEARLASERQFDEPFVFNGDPKGLSEAVLKKGLSIIRGRLHHLSGENDKGKAVEILISLYRNLLGDIRTIALGDSPADESMLNKVDHPILIRKDNGSHDIGVTAPGLVISNSTGPEGWNRAVLDLI